MKKTAVILYNLGGPDSLESVKPFLFNLFYDPAIITLPNPFRWMIAKLISKRRASTAKRIYEHLGGKSPIVEETKKQERALEKLLMEGEKESEYKVFTCMRYWHPLPFEVIDEVHKYGPDELILLPLYPQFSTTTTGSFMSFWKQSAHEKNFSVPTKNVCCYPSENFFIEAQTKLLKATYLEATQYGEPRILFSAHGLPKKIADSGDPYAIHIQNTAEAIVRNMDLKLDWKITFQSRVGPLEWLKPDTEEEIKLAGKDKVPVVILPISFVSEHSETLVELDIEYRKIAEEHGVPFYGRVPAIGIEENYIKGLAGLCKKVTREKINCIHSEQRGQPCSSKCPKLNIAS